MGKKAKLKQLKRQTAGDASQPDPAPKPNLDNTQFVQQLKQEGYDLKQMQQSPEIPDRNRPNPQL